MKIDVRGAISRFNKPVFAQHSFFAVSPDGDQRRVATLRVKRTLLGGIRETLDITDFTGRRSRLRFGYRALNVWLEHGLHKLGNALHEGVTGSTTETETIEARYGSSSRANLSTRDVARRVRVSQEDVTLRRDTI